ncbi:MAG: polymer-forming cytoskeletal protein [Polyangiaceae bacterium]
MASTYVAAGITIEGELSADDAIEIAGTLKGRVQSKGAVAIRSGAVVEAEVGGNAVQVAGARGVTGNVTAVERIDFEPGARLIGDVRAVSVRRRCRASPSGRQRRHDV